MRNGALFAILKVMRFLFDRPFSQTFQTFWVGKAGTAQEESITVMMAAFHLSEIVPGSWGCAWSLSECFWSHTCSSCYVMSKHLLVNSWHLSVYFKPHVNPLRFLSDECGCGYWLLRNSSQNKTFYVHSNAGTFSKCFKLHLCLTLTGRRGWCGGYN